MIEFYKAIKQLRESEKKIERGKKIMRWRNQRQSENVEDRRGMSGGRGLAIGGGGIGTLVLILVLWMCGADPSQLLSLLSGGGSSRPAQTQQQPQVQPGGQNDENRQFVSAVLGSTEDVWNKVLPEQAGTQYRAPILVLFTNSTSSACGYASAATGPFYCPGDQKLYLDFGFFSQLKTEFQAEGDFAEAYVIAHEVGHHVQDLLGTMTKAGSSNEASVRVELQADCYAGVWAYYANKDNLVEAGDIKEAIRAAEAVGDDAIQKRTQGYVVPDSFTHGTSDQRERWFTSGYQSGDMRQCDTFGR